MRFPDNAKTCNSQRNTSRDTIIYNTLPGFFRPIRAFDSNAPPTRFAGEIWGEYVLAVNTLKKQDGRRKVVGAARMLWLNGISLCFYPVNFKSLCAFKHWWYNYREGRFPEAAVGDVSQLAASLAENKRRLAPVMFTFKYLTVTVALND